MDGSSKYTSNIFSTYLADNGIKCELTNVYTPQENGVSEHANHTLNNLAQSMIADTKEVLQHKSLPASLWSHAICHVAWIKNQVFTLSLNPYITPYQAYFKKKPSLATLQLFGCKAYAHTPKIDESKFMECTIECIHVGFAEEKRAYLLYSQEHRQLFESQDVEFEEVEGQEQVMVDLDSDDDGIIDPPSTENGDPEGGHMDETVDNDVANVPSSPVKEADHQDLSPGTPAHPSAPQPLQCSACSNKGIPPMHLDEDPKLLQGSRPSTKRTTTPTPAVQDPANISVGADKCDTSEDGPLLNVIDDDVGALYLTTDAPQLYKAAMRCDETNGWVEAIMEEYQNLHHKGVFIEVDMRANWFSQKRSGLRGKSQRRRHN